MISYRICCLIPFSYLAISVGTFSYIALLLFLTSDVQALNIIIGTTNTTVGTEDDDAIIGCSHLDAHCSQGSFLFGLEGDDSLQGSTADDWIFGDEGNDEITGADGNDKLFGGDGRDVLQGGFGSDFLYGGPGNDELYSGPGDDKLVGGKGADYFDCGDGYDTIIDFEPLKGDTKAENCEIALTHNPKDIEFLCDSDSLVSSPTITRLTNSTISMNNNIIEGGSEVNMSSGISGVTCNALKQDESISLFSSSSSSSTLNRKFIPTTSYKALTEK
ncbi:MAG: calcium-binding protein [Nitrososphaeraceae archaeon]